MFRCSSILVVAAALTGAAASVAVGQDSTHAVPASSITFTDIAVPGFDAGMKIAVINGNPDEAGLYTLRLSFPDGYRFPAHFHPMDENVTVLSGTLLLAMGDRADDAKLKAYGTGDFLHMPATRPHFGGARGATVIQLHGQGPFKIELAQASSN
jgi:quercetin dioxygenase-like cupin family protein